MDCSFSIEGSNTSQICGLLLALNWNWNVSIHHDAIGPVHTNAVVEDIVDGAVDDIRLQTAWDRLRGSLIDLVSVHDYVATHSAASRLIRILAIDICTVLVQYLFSLLSLLHLFRFLCRLPLLPLLRSRLLSRAL